LAAGWSERALLHAVAVCGLFNYVNRIADGTGVVGTPEVIATAAQHLVSNGYAYRGQKLFRLIAILDSMVATLWSWLGAESNAPVVGNQKR
jgi:hypothetical protein